MSGSVAEISISSIVTFMFISPLELLLNETNSSENFYLILVGGRELLNFF